MGITPKCAWCNRTRTCRVSHLEMGRGSSYCCDSPKCLVKAKANVGAEWHDQWEIVPMPPRPAIVTVVQPEIFA
jgi:hypothetical protein